MAKILLVDDEVTMVQMVTEVLRAEAHEVYPFTTAHGVLEAMADKKPDLVITDLYLDKTRAYGMEILQKARSMSPPPVCIMITGFGSVESAVEAMRHGAYDYLEKPFKLDELKLCIQRALSFTVTVAENVFLRKELKKRFQFSQIIGRSAPIQEVFQLVERMADTETTALILGESGTGKELVARALHFHSRRQSAPFIPINCSALPENLLESELFGHRKGSFTGAINDKNGLFHDADGGTIFLDEIGTMPAQLQSRLLRVLQEKEVRRVGDNTPTYVNVRVVAATNENLEQLVKSGKFREDLYYRLNIIPITLPPLRDRASDIPLLVAHFIKSRVHPHTGQPLQISTSAMKALLAHPWPGNVRELENAIERAAVLGELPVIRVKDLPPVIQKAQPVADPAEASDIYELPAGEPPPVRPPSTTGTNPAGAALASGGGHGRAVGTFGGPIVTLKKFIKDQEVAYISHVLASTGQNKEETARLLEVSLATLYRKLAGEGD